MAHFRSQNIQVLLNDGNGNRLPIQTGTWISPAYDILEARRLSLTIAVNGSTGVPGGGFSGALLVQGTNELPQMSIDKVGSGAGVAWAAAGPQPGANAYTGALYWNTIPSGTIAIGPILNSGNSMEVDFTDVCPRFIRLAFNQSATGSIPVAGAGGSGTMYVTLTTKST